MKDPEDEAFEELALKQGQWSHTSGWRKRQIEQDFAAIDDANNIRKKQIMEQKMNIPHKVPKAFPNVFWREDDGMDLRDYFAAKAMQGLVIQKSFIDLYSAGATAVAQQAYLVADAMLKAREQNAT